MAMTHRMKEPIWLWTLFADLKKTQTHSKLIYCDNQSGIALTFNPKYRAHTKHIEIYYDFSFKKKLKMCYYNIVQQKKWYLISSPKDCQRKNIVVVVQQQELKKIKNLVYKRK